TLSSRRQAAADCPRVSDLAWGGGAGAGALARRPRRAGSVRVASARQYTRSLRAALEGVAGPLPQSHRRARRAGATGKRLCRPLHHRARTYAPVAATSGAGAGGAFRNRTGPAGANGLRRLRRGFHTRGPAACLLVQLPFGLLAPA